ncbi:DarT ssDNA thymidine ADP-ribosyltransferase family protein [Undibacterium sp. Ji50W]|uniref:DarT ssDNA thymidine ADP-ribosyltransferase family protein n=1 Tax=Undibacterium sp. Ji50W TaxID=3413041 RepID=UPI003BF00097
MTFADLEAKISERNITEVLHFTTNNGLLGIFSTESLLAHSELPNEKRLSHILQINCKDRSRDSAWHSYVNLSISKINGTFFSISKRWHASADIFWCILSFSPEIMTHENVVFSTTNNAYDLTERATGHAGFESLFKPSVRQFPTKLIIRPKTAQMMHTTCNQAEILYPKSVSISYLRRIYLSSYEHLHEVEAQIGVCSPNIVGTLDLIVAPELFS